MKNKKGKWIIIISILAIAIIGFISYQILNDNNKLSSSERKWLNNHINDVQNISVVNDVNIFGNTGAGVYYEFIHDLENEYKLQINPVTFNNGEVSSGLTLGVKTSLGKNDTIFYTDHYVLVGKNTEVITSYEAFQSKRIGVINSEISYISSYLKNVNNLSLTGYENREALLNAFMEGVDFDYIIVPFTLYLDEILKNNYTIISHLADVHLYYTISGPDDSTLTKIVKKFYNSWRVENLDAYFKKCEFDLFTTSLNISKTEVDSMRSVTYNYGFIDNSPYEVLMSGNYGGIIAMYLHDFSEFSGVELDYTKYRNIDKFKKAINTNKVDLYFNYYNLKDNLFTLSSRIPVQYSVVANLKNDLVVHSLNSLIGKTVYVDKNSYLYSYINSINGINIKTYETESELKKLNKKDVIIILDKNIYNLYSNNELSNYTERYSSNLKENYQFKSRNNSALYQLLSKYIMCLDRNKMIYNGMYNHSLTVKTGSILGSIAKYILLTLAAFFILFIIFYKSSKKIKIAKKIRKENKMKFIDQLTSLKNRNYLNEYIENWNNNTVYPQTMIVIDLNNLQFINDTLGYEEGDKQITAAANILIKTQLDNSDIMRTDGNEFLIYLVGYTQKQITNYIHKLNKEFKKLPYEYGAEFGYSIINDDIKTIEDAILEATDEMKKQKKKNEEGE